MKWDLNRVLINEISKGSIPFSAAGPNQAGNMQRSSTWMENNLHQDNWEHCSLPQYYRQSVYPKIKNATSLFQQLKGQKES